MKLLIILLKEMDLKEEFRESANRFVKSDMGEVELSVRAACMKGAIQDRNY
jgi:hypothetical protein